MPWTKPPQALIDLFTESLPDLPGLERRRMFGLPAAFVNGTMLAGVFQDSIFARLPPEIAERLTQDEGAKAFEPMPGRPMKAYLEMPDEVVADETRLAEMLHAAFTHTATLPPKVKAPPSARAKAKAKAKRA